MRWCRSRQVLTAMAVASVGALLLTGCKPVYRLHTGEALASGQEKRSANGVYRLAVQGDGNVVLRTADGTALWSAKTSGNGGARLVMRSRGDLVVQRASGSIAWTTYSGVANSVADLGDDGNLVVWGPSRQPTWASGTSLAGSGRVRASERTVSSHQLVLTKIYEGYGGSRPYRDSAGHCTVGYGHLIRYGACWSSDLSRTWDPEALFAADVAEHERRLKQSLGSVPMSQREYDALFDYVFNRGSITASTSPGIYSAMTASPPRYGDVAPLLEANGNASSAGLCDRRHDEAEVFRGGRYDRSYRC